jgi:hypothetical protein
MTRLPKILWWTVLILALILLIEGAALFIGLNLLSPGFEWTITNNLLLIIDIFVAAGLLRLEFRQPDLEKSMGLNVLLVITIVTHAYRGIEYVLPVPTKFLFNEALFWVNMLKLGLAIVALIIGIYLQTRTAEAT